MKAAVIRRFGGPEVVHVEDLPRPAPKVDEVLIRVRTTTVSTADYRSRSRDLPPGLGFLAPVALGIFRPRHPILGMDLTGVVESVGPAVTKFKPGDEVIAMPGSGFGGHAEYRTMPQDGAVAMKPANMDFDEAVTLVFGGRTALAYLDLATVRPGETVLVNGASGAVGVAAVQVAKSLGAEVIGVCSGRHAELVASLGADSVIDYEKSDFAAERDRYDVIVECVGNAPFERVEHALRPGGRLAFVVVSLGSMLGASRNSRRSGKPNIVLGGVNPTADELSRLAALAEAGGWTPVIDSTHALDDIVAAHARVDTHHKTGNVVVRL
jgi:NADPH:quinone reductase-like Zn-dependent oxidoreductase